MVPAGEELTFTSKIFHLTPKRDYKDISHSTESVGEKSFSSVSSWAYSFVFGRTGGLSWMTTWILLTMFYEKETENQLLNIWFIESNTVFSPDISDSNGNMKTSGFSPGNFYTTLNHPVQSKVPGNSWGAINAAPQRNRLKSTLYSPGKVLKTFLALT